MEYNCNTLTASDGRVSQVGHASGERRQRGPFGEPTRLREGSPCAIRAMGINGAQSVRIASTELSPLRYEPEVALTNAVLMERLCALVPPDVQLLVQRIRARVLRALRKAGKWVDEDAAADADCAPADDLLPGLAAAAVAGRAAFGERAGRRDGRIGGDGRWRPQAKGPLCAALDGFSLHANTWVAPRDRERLCGARLASKCWSARSARAQHERIRRAIRALHQGRVPVE